MTKFQDEKDFQQFIVNYLTSNNGFVERKFPKLAEPGGMGWRRELAIDTDVLFEFLEKSQPDSIAQLKKFFKAKWRETILNYINREIVKKGGSLLYALKHGVEIQNVKIDLMYRKPEHPKVVEQAKKYAMNIFSVAQEVWASDTERVDLVIFINGLAIASFELKCNTSGQGYIDAVNQYKNKRNPETRLFVYPSGCLVNFAMDLDEVYMTTRLNKDKTVFLPFNRGCGVGVNAGKGNSPIKGKYAVSYIWEDILTKDTLTELVMKFMFFEVIEDEDENGRKFQKETLIFPRYHQLDCVRKLLADVRENGTARNYLIQHSAGSGKTNSIAWLAHRLASLHDEDGNAIDDNVIIVTDRVVVDRQLQRAIKAIEHKDGLIKVMDEDCTSDDLAKAINGHTKIIATTIQKFPYIVEKVETMENKHFGVIIDEAHSSTSGKDMIAVTKVLGLGVKLGDDASPDEVIQAILRKHGKQSNVSMFAFTATPKPETLQLFGTLDETGHKGPFHLYSMKQAIEEGFILDVLQRFVGYKTYFEIIKKVEDDPFYKQRKAASKIVRYAMLHPENVRQRSEVIVEHFCTKVLSEIGGEAKAMVVTSGRKEAVAYAKAIKRYVDENGLEDIGVLVAFSGSVKVDGHEVTESVLNGFPEKSLTKEFKKKKYRILVVANKYQTGFDEKRLCAMYVIKGLSGIAAVQTLSRLNRIYKPHNKKTFILDFVNTSADIEKAFEPYYTTTILAESVTPQKLYRKLADIEKFGIIDDDDVCEVWKILSESHRGKDGRFCPKDQQRITNYLDHAKAVYQKLDDEEAQRNFLSALGTFCKWYEFIVQASQLNDTNLYRKYRFIDLLEAHLQEGHVVEVINLSDKINARNFEQEIKEQVEKTPIISKPGIALPDEKTKQNNDDIEEQLSKIIEEVNSRYAKALPKTAVHSLMQIRSQLLSSKKLERAAKANGIRDFKLPYHQASEAALADSYDTSRETYEFLLKNKDAAALIFNAMLRDVYNSLRSKEG